MNYIDKDIQRYVPELVESIRRNQPLLHRTGNTNPTILGIDKNSDSVQLQKWLTQKGFSEQTKKTFEHFTPLELFRLSIDQLRNYCGNESKRLYSLLLVQKKQSNFDEDDSENQLRNLLNMRREYINGESEIRIELASTSHQMSCPISSYLL